MSRSLFMIWCLFAPLLLFCVTPAQAQYTYYGPYINSDDQISLKVNQYVTAPSNNHFFIMQDDGNLCLYGGSSPYNNTGYIWCNFNYGHTVGDFFEIIVTSSGKAVEGQKHGTDPETAIWTCQMTDFLAGSYKLFIEETPSKAYVSLKSVNPSDPYYRCST